MEGLWVIHIKYLNSCNYEKNNVYNNGMSNVAFL
jgi:hypothetical protein